MYLKKIEAKGFKSFADKIEVELDRGITGIVGPNGSGKSNISDAVRWVLGEQSAKNLRGGKMEDVIFAGTDLRKPLGFSEVSITIDNGDNMLPVDYTEVTVTRRMYRSGESEYYINKTGCRLKDITELFMDTGIGKDGYSIIGQGRIDEILSTKPESRREIFEEAAGIVKYKTRKLESERKLNTTEQNITRVDDIINELEIQLEPLHEQSQKAKKYLDLREKLKVLELNMCIRNLDKIKEKVSIINENCSSMEKELQENNEKSEKTEKEYTSLKTQLLSIEEAVEKMQDLMYSTNSEIEKSQGEVRVLNEKILNIQNNILRLEEEIDKEKLRSDRYEKSLEENKNNAARISDLLKEQLTLLGNKNAEFESVSNEISQKNEFIENMKSEVIELLNLIADKKSSVNSYITFRNGIEKRKNQINIEKANKLGEKHKLLETLVNIEEEISHNKLKLESEILRMKTLEGHKTDALSQKKEVDKNIFHINERLQSKQARYRMLYEMETEFEGYNKSVKEIMKLQGSEKLWSKDICGVVADILKVPARYEVAVEVALGASLQNVVTEDEVTAKKCIEYLKINKFGRATFLPLTTVRGKGNGFNNSAIKNMRGFIGFGSNLVAFDSKYTGIISSLLGRVVIVDTMDNAIPVAQKINYTLKIVTLDGDIINPGGAFTGGSISQKTGKILSRKREIEELSAALNELQNMLKAEKSKKNEIERTLSGLEESIKNAVEEKHSTEITISSWDNKYNQAALDKKRLESQLGELDVEFSQLEKEYAEVINKIDEESKVLKEYEDKSELLSNSVQFEQSNIKDILERKENLSSEVTSLKIRAAEYRQEISSIEDKIKELSYDIETCKSLIDDKMLGKLRAADAIKSVGSQRKALEEAINSLEQKKIKAKDELENLYSQKKLKASELDSIEAQKKEYSETCQILQGEIHKMDMQKAKLEMEMENIQNKIWDDYEVSYVGALKYKIEIENISQAVKDINAIKEDIKDLGTVNVGAVEEYKRVKDRYEFLMKQKMDLEEAKDSLMKVIVEMEESMREQFTKNFAIINKNFNEVFQQLFGGGRAELILCDEENILESGVEIIAQPPGKRLQNLTLLSGGEKALTAISLLFGILKMKPSPFCILDEIEAALDDANVDRYARFLRQFSKQTQFIIVTHRKGTMEASDALYGVTMEEKGVSRLVSVKLSEKVS